MPEYYCREASFVIRDCDPDTGQPLQQTINNACKCIQRNVGTRANFVVSQRLTDDLDISIQVYNGNTSFGIYERQNKLLRAYTNGYELIDRKYANALNALYRMSLEYTKTLELGGKVMQNAKILLEWQKFNRDRDLEL